jgi:hypothetical protein
MDRKGVRHLHRVSEFNKEVTYASEASGNLDIADSGNACIRAVNGDFLRELRRATGTVIGAARTGVAH